MTGISFAVTWDYRCPFARNAHEHIVAGLRDGADWDVSFVPFSLNQMHIEEGDPPAFDEPERYPGLLANEAGIVVRDQFPDKFLGTHLALFAARHDETRDLRERAVIAQVLSEQGVEADAVLAAMVDGWPLDTFRKEHEAAEADHHVWGVPTFILGDRAVFVRLMTRPDGDGALARRTIERVLALIDSAPELNEFKYTSIPR
jgi:DSBA-like thioredoxin domain-containing protein